MSKTHGVLLLCLGLVVILASINSASAGKVSRSNSNSDKLNKTRDCSASDGSDDFLGCENSCKNTTCTQGCIPDPSVNATGSGKCVCWEGYTLQRRDRDKGICVDIDECKEFGKCSQQCTNLLGSYECSCINGFRLSKDNSSCELIEQNASLIYAFNSGVRVYKMEPKKPHYYSIVEKTGSPVSVTFDARNDWVYWTDAIEQEETIWRSRLNGSEIQAVVTSGLILPEGIAFDWIANNIYFTDSNKSHIVVCTADGGNCTVLIQEQMDKPRDLAVHPNQGLLFWTDWGIEPSIIKAGMDGSIPFAIIQDNLKWPNGITIDYGNGRIYWTDASTDRIETATLDGEDRRVVRSTGIKHPFGVDVLGDMVYWSDWNMYEIQKSNKFDGSNHETLVKEPYEQLNGLTIFHKANQPINRRNHCSEAGCSHICTLTPKNSFRCMCPSGMYLDKRNKRTCADNKAWPKFVLSYNNTIKVAPIEAIGSNIFSVYVIPGLKSIGAITAVPYNDTVFVSDLENKKIYSFEFKTKKLRVIVEGNIGFVKGMDYDEIGNNLYWVDSEEKTIEVLSLKTMTRVILFKEIDRPYDIVVAANLRMIFLAEVGDQGGKIVRMNMNGFNRRVLFRRSDGEPMTLTYNKVMKRIYWTDFISDTIESIGIDGTSSYLAVSRAGAPFGITSYGNKIFWTDRHLQLLKGKQLDTYVDERGIFIGDAVALNNGHFPTFTPGQILTAKVTMMNPDLGYESPLVTSHDCSPHRNQCSHVCLLASEGLEGTCICPSTLKLEKNGRTCVPLEAGDLPTPALCQEGRCRTQVTTKKPKSSTTPSTSNPNPKPKSNDGKFISEKNATSKLTSTTDSSVADYVEEGFDWTPDESDEKKKSSKSKKNKKKPSDKETRKIQKLDYDDYEGSPPANAKMLPNGTFVLNGEHVVQLESNEDKNKVTDGKHPLAIVFGIFLILVLVGVIVGIVLHRRNVHPKVLVRPYVQQWVKYVNQPVQRFFEQRGGEQMDGKNRHIYDEVYHNPSAEHTYSSGYEKFDDESVNATSDSHRISYGQKEKLIQ